MTRRHRWWHAGIRTIEAEAAWFAEEGLARAHARLLTSAYENSPGLAAPVA
jgi:hypothetical protein